MVNPGSVCDVYNNLIKDGAGRHKVYNNVIVRVGSHYPPGHSFGNGITIAKETSGGEVMVANKTIVEPSHAGIRYENDDDREQLIKNNVIVQPGNQGEHIAAGRRANVAISNNFTCPALAPVKFVNPTSDDFRLQADSPPRAPGLTGTHLMIIKSRPDPVSS